MSENKVTDTWSRLAFVWVPGEPVAQPRHRMTKSGRAYTPDPKRKDGSRPVSEWKRLVSEYTAEKCPAEPIDGPVRVDISFFMPRPQRLMRKSSPLDPVPHTVKPDKDNLEKLVLDAMTKVGWWTDDCRVCSGTTTKHYRAKDMDCGAAITVSVTPLM